MNAARSNDGVVLVDRSGDVVSVMLNRPEVHNAFDAQLIAELKHVFTELSQDSSVRVILLRGAGRSFCAGADVNWMRASLDLSEEENIEDALRMSDTFAAINETPQVVIGVAHGAALGGGMGLLAVCDIVLSTVDCKFGFTETRLGIIPAVISRFVVPRIGSSWARRLFLTGERFDVHRAMQIGLVHEILNDAQITSALECEQITSLIDEVRMAGPQAVREAKALIAGLEEIDSGAHRQFTAESIAAVRTSPEGQEGLRAFLARRNPSWRDGS